MDQFEGLQLASGLLVAVIIAKYLVAPHNEMELPPICQTRGIKIHRKAETVEINDHLALAVHPQRLWSWGMQGQAFKDGEPVSRKATFA